MGFLTSMTPIRLYDQAGVRTVCFSASGRRVGIGAAPINIYGYRRPLRAYGCQRGSVGSCDVDLGPVLQTSYLNARPQRVQFQTAKSDCFTVGAVSKS